MDSEKTLAGSSSASRCYAFMESNGTIDFDSIAETEDAVRRKMLGESMGWRFEHPDRYSQDDEWKRLLTFGKVIPVVVSAGYA